MSQQALTCTPAHAQLLTAGEVAQLLRISRWAVYDLGRRGVLPVLRIGRCCRYDRQAVLAAMAGNVLGS